MRSIVIALLVCSAVGAGVRPAAAATVLHTFDGVAIAPTGGLIASVDGVDVPGAMTPPVLVVRTAAGRVVSRFAACSGSRGCTIASPVWSADGRRIVFVRTDFVTHRSALESVSPAGGLPHDILSFAGQLQAPLFMPDGRSIAVLATAGAHKQVGATQAGAPMVGEVGTSFDEQRIAIVDPAGHLKMVSPPDLFVYEYDVLPNGEGFVGTGAHGDGDNNWWVARLYAFGGDGTARELYAPPMQIASPRVSADGRSVAFIGGLMSDFGSTGGDVFVVPTAGGDAKDLTASQPLSATSLLWNGRSDALTYVALAGDQTQIRTVGLGAPSEQTLWSGPVTLGSFAAAQISVARNGISAVVRQTFERAPEIAVGSIGAWRDVTNANAALPPAGRSTSLTWKSDAFNVQGWLLSPMTTDGKKHPMVVDVHGGPSAAVTPRYIGDGFARDALAHGYYIFLPNPRGSFGQGEAFVRANIKDFGGGDLRDILAGVDETLRAAPVDGNRLGITGGSYGGYMTMWAVTQTQRFKAAVAIAGVSNWLSYYGENGIDQWMIPFFGASVYDDPAVYAKSSPITFIKNVKTPTLIAVGERDVECPMPQSQEFWHALVTLGVPTSFIVYPGEGHHLRLPQHQRDLSERALAWFDRYLR
jgi:dipeptidyl aminopeptidase/acylaminoacyl peptidase